MGSTIAEIKDTAFAKYTLSLPHGEAVNHLFRCLAGPKEDNMAWELWTAVHGDRRFPFGNLVEAINQMLEALRA